MAQPKFLANLRAASESLLAIRAKVLARLPPDDGPDGATRRLLVGARNAFSSTGPDAEQTQSLLINLFERAAGMCETLQRELTAYHAEMNTEIWAESQRRKAEREAEWASWFQRTIRWVIGAAIVVTVYSCAVNLAEAELFDGWIHVPVHDWLAKSEGK